MSRRGASPRSRGWTLLQAAVRLLAFGFPALAGMDLDVMLSPAPAPGFPALAGMDPWTLRSAR